MLLSGRYMWKQQTHLLNSIVKYIILLSPNFNNEIKLVWTYTNFPSVPYNTIQMNNITLPIICLGDYPTFISTVATSTSEWGQIVLSIQRITPTMVQAYAYKNIQTGTSVGITGRILVIGF